MPIARDLPSFPACLFTEYPKTPNHLTIPKTALLNLVRRYGKKNVKADILPQKGSTAKVGLAYNQALCAFVQAILVPG